MALSELPFRPGVIKDETEYGARGYATDTNLIRWVRGKPETLGGWVQVASNIHGAARAMHEWALSDGRPFCAIGTDSKLYAWDGTKLVDITPLRLGGTLGADPVATTNGSAIVTITDASHGAVVGDTVWIRGLTSVATVQIGGTSTTGLSGPFTTTIGSTLVKVTHTAHGLVDNDIVIFTAVGAAVGGIAAATFINPFRVRFLNANTYQIEVPATATSTATGGGTVDVQHYKPYVILTTPSSSTFTIQALTPANATTTGGGAGGYAEYDLNVGRSSGSTAKSGFGAGLFGAGPFGKSSGSGVVDTAPQLPRQWSFDNFGNILVACVSGGTAVSGLSAGNSLFAWPFPAASLYRAAVITNSPAKVTAVAVTPERILLACGCTNGAGTFDPSLVRNCEIEDFTVWTPTATNSAGDFRLGTGSRIVGTVKRESGPMIFTDAALYGLRFVGSFDQIYEQIQVGVDCGLLALNCATQRDNDVFWITPSYQFMVYRGGRPQSLECPLREWFENERLNKSQADKIFGYPDTRFEALSWTFPAGESEEPNEYIRLDVPEQRRDALAGWGHGVLDRSAYVAGRVFASKKPLAASASGFLYEHENGFSDNGSPRSPSVEWAPIDLQDGQKRVSISRIIVDMENEQNATLLLTVREYPKAPGRSKSLTVTPTTQRCDTRLSGRQLGLRVAFPPSTFARLSSVRGDLSERGVR